MPAMLDEDTFRGVDAPTPTMLEFPPVTKQHILNCSYHAWHPKYKTVTPRSRLVPLTPPFLEYLRADGIVLPDDEDPTPVQSDDDSAYISASDAQDDDDDDDVDVAAAWRQVHRDIRAAIAELKGNVLPKLNWSAPKDATWMNANTMECKKPSEIYLLLKSSDFITHDLEHAFDDCVDDEDESTANGSEAAQELTINDIPYHLALRKVYPNFNQSVEFRCFVRDRKLLCICQRDLNHYNFLLKLEYQLSRTIYEFFGKHLRETFPDSNFVFDVYVPQPYTKPWLVDINPWAPRTDPILFSWQELLTMPAPPDLETEEPEPEPVQQGSTGVEQDFVRFSIDPARRAEMLERFGLSQADLDAADDGEDTASNSDEEEADEDIYYLPELRLIHQNDPEAHSFATPQYSAHKMPKDVVEASQNGEGLMEFAKEWRKHLEKAQDANRNAESSGED